MELAPDTSVPIDGWISEQVAVGEGEIDVLIGDVAASREATLVTSDKVQTEVVRAKPLDVRFPDGARLGP